MWEKVRASFRELLAAAPPGERRSIMAQMKDTLVQARMGLDDLRDAVKKTRARVDVERQQLETVLRRKKLALDINDTETVGIAERFEKQHTERLAALQLKLEGETAELAIAEREVDEMKRELKLASAGAIGLGSSGAHETVGEDGESRPGGAGFSPSDPLGESAAGLGDEIDGLGRARRRAEREATADAQLEALKRRMGK
jgi:hypothetical protein